MSGAPVPELLALPAGAFTMGSGEQRYPADGEGPPHTVTVGAFRIAARAVSNDDFATFAAATGYFTTAEREGWSFVFAGLLPAQFPADAGGGGGAVVAAGP
jgi:formylglycine-generating enzyme